MPRRGTFPRRARALLLAAALASAAAQAVPAATVLTVDGARLEVELDSGAFRAGGAVLTAWITRSARIVAGYYGRFPAARLTIRVRPQGGAGVQGGSTFGVPRPLIRVRVGREVTEAQLLHDWVLVHEMIHLALPDVGAEHAWLSEGLATYVEGVARVQAGNRPEEDVWAEEIREMPYGLPQAGDAGLDRTHSWGRTYWGGAMFCLLADVDIRRATHNRLGLEDALRAILRASGGLAAEWPIERVLRTGDAAVGTTTLEDLYARLRDRPVTPDLMGLWRELGVEPEGSSVRLTDGAPLAPLRHAIMTAKRSPS
ncbi:MAG TPA: hypothetical protein VFK87_03230 [Steroidobacteraceae bacterium]|nr:hypothetical protein [Steroidobacteraceae bacterium]